MTKDDDVIIGYLSGTTLCAWALLLVFLAAVFGWPIVDTGPDLAAVAGLTVTLALLVFYLYAIYRLITAGNVGMFVRDGALHVIQFGVFTRVTPLTSIRSVRREVFNRRGFVRNGLIFETGGPPPENRMLWTSTGGFEVVTTFFKTPAAEMLEKLEACGVNVVGSKTGTFGL